MKASFPPFVSCFPPWSGFASPRRLKSACHRGDGWAQKLSATACNRLDGTADKRLLLGEKAFIAMRFQCAWPSLRTIAISHARFPHSAIASRAAQLDARAGEARPKGKSEGMTGRSLLQTKQRKVFPALRCNQGHTQFNASSIYVANRFFGTFLTQESTVPFPSSLRLLLHSRIIHPIAGKRQS